MENDDTVGMSSKPLRRVRNRMVVEACYVLSFCGIVMYNQYRELFDILHYTSMICVSDKCVIY